jgi:hypothetical protein
MTPNDRPQKPPLPLSELLAIVRAEGRLIDDSESTGSVAIVGVPIPPPEPHPTTNPVFRKWLKNPRFRKIEGPQGGGIIITGYGPTSPPADEPPQPKPEASHDDE